MSRQKQNVLRAGLLSFLAPLTARAQSVPNFGRIAEFVRWGGLAASVPLVIGAVFVIRLIETSGDHLSLRFSNRRPMIQKVQTTLRFLLYILTFGLTASLSIRLDSTALTVIGGALAFAVGFALRDLVAAFIAGITIMFDRPFQVGDRVSYGGQYGDIIKIGLRSVRMNTLDHNIITIPNNKVFTDVTSSANYGALEMQVPMDFYIGVDQDAVLAAELVREACLTSPYVFLLQPVPVLAKQVILQDYLAFHLKVRPYVFDSKYEKPFETDVHFRVLEAFRDHGIGPPAVLHRQLAASAPHKNDC
ncbi:MAG: mechanosensitive ion channel domain-containing protein [Pseudomonadota bacterium]